MLEQRDHSTGFFPADIRDRLDDPIPRIRDLKHVQYHLLRPFPAVCLHAMQHDLHKDEHAVPQKHGVSEIGTPELRNRIGDRNDRRYSKSCFRIQCNAKG